jgi:hypothetical protein
MHLRVERTRRRGVAQRRDRLAVAALFGEGDPEVERRVCLVGLRVEHRAKGALSLRELLLLQAQPPVSEARVDRRRGHPCGEASTATRVAPQQ